MVQPRRRTLPRLRPLGYAGGAADAPREDSRIPVVNDGAASRWRRNRCLTNGAADELAAQPASERSKAASAEPESERQRGRHVAGLIGAHQPPDGEQRHDHAFPTPCAALTRLALVRAGVPARLRLDMGGARA